MPERSQAVNFPIQSTAADISNLALIAMDARMKEREGANLVHTFYDANDIECFEEDADWAVGVMKEHMSAPVKVGNYVLEIPLEVKISPDWGLV